ncbi:hypothetical protein RCL1_004981 [Eukaryota sp. TZLM3-RCL]
MTSEDEYLYSSDEDFTPNVVLSGPAREELRRDLLEQLETTKTALRERTIELNHAKNDKDDLAVQIYSRQRELGLVQSKLDDLSSQVEQLQQKRREYEALRDSAKIASDKEKKEVDGVQLNLSKLQSELSKLHESLRLAAKFQDSEVDHIELMRRAAYKGEEEIKQLESLKQSQDLRLAEYHHQLHSQEESLALIKGQIDAQKSEVENARAILKEALDQISKIEGDKRHVLSQWQSAIIGVQKRDESLAQVTSVIGNERQRLQLTESTLSSINQTIMTSQDEAEKLSFNLKKTQAELSSLEGKLSKLKEEEIKLSTNYGRLRSDLGKVEDSTADHVIQSKNLEKEKSNLLKQKQSIEEKIVLLGRQLTETASDTLTIERTRHHLADDIQSIQRRIQLVERDLLAQENEKFRITLDIQNVLSNVNSLEVKEKSSVSELKELENVLKDLELEIRRRHDDVAKKQSKLQNLNRKLEVLTSRQVDENFGELEAKISNIGREIKQSEDECLVLESSWLRKQTELVELESKESNMMENVRNLSAKSLILRQRQLRVQNVLNGLKKSVDFLSKNVDSMHRKMTRVNHFVSRLDQNQSELIDQLFNTESCFIDRLTQLEKESLHIDDVTNQIRAQKDALLTDIPEAEKQVQLFERMIQIQREMEATLNPSGDESVIKSMEQEIQRMKLRLKELKRRQQEVTDAMVRAVQKRKHIRVKAQAVAGSVKKTNTESVKVAKFKRQLQFSDEQLSAVHSEISQLRNYDQSISSSLDDLEGQIRHYQQLINQIQEEISTSSNTKEQLLLRVSRLQSIVKGYMNNSTTNSTEKQPNTGRLSSASSRPQSAISVSSVDNEKSINLERLDGENRLLSGLIDRLISAVPIGSEAHDKVKRLKNVALSAEVLVVR